MVNNEGRSTKNRLLARLRVLGGEAVSGEVLAAELGVSRVAVWKAAAALREAGYAIEASEDGYWIIAGVSDDFLYPWEFGEDERRFRHYPETTSTMDRARDLQRKNALPPGSVVVAEAQSAGRGRAGRSWVSEKGGLFFTLALGPGAPVLRSARVAAAAQLALGAALKTICGARAAPRWPNDVYASGRKIAGVLVELEGSGDAITRLSLGVGVNVNRAPAGAASCAELAGRPVSRREVLAAFLDAFAREAPFDDPELEKRWNAAAEGLGARAALLSAAHGERASPEADRFAAARFRGMDELGRAVLEDASGTRFVDPGSASLRFG